MVEPGDFPKDLGGNRVALLEDAATRVARMGRLMSDKPGGRTPASNEVVGVLRAMTEDQAAFGGFPGVTSITPRTFKDAGLTTPARLAQLSRDFRFYEVRFPMMIWPRGNWAFTRLEAWVRFNHGQPPVTRPTAYQILPNALFETRAEWRNQVEVRLNGEFEYEIDVPKTDIGVGAAGGQAGAALRAESHLVVGPFTYRLKKARIQHTAVGLEEVYWRLYGARFFQDDVRELIVILQVPRAIARVTVEGQIRATRRLNSAAAGLIQAVQQLPEAIRAFFHNGAPVGEESPVSWDISSRL